ncbi:MAG: hypothetical protein A2X00_10565 [Bacteroidetes bacterium GWE2_32_14]|nr:MAG: hypothetical protein A2X00_10565 [Bacteroidetes bacterium GWE2_32_14]
MALHFTCSREIIEEAIKEMKNNNKISQEAFFNPNAIDGYRKEVAYRDMDFLEYLGFCSEEKIVNSALNILKGNHLISQEASYNKEFFLELRSEVKMKFVGDWGTITPALERLLYMFSSVKRPKKILAIGIFWGNAFIWNVGSSCGKGKVYEANKIYGVDIDPEAVRKAKGNINKLNGIQNISIVEDDGVSFVKNIDATFDYLYLDVGISKIEKAINYKILKEVYSKLEHGAWIIAHDTTHPFYRESFKKYLEFVRNKEFFSESICFDFDSYGLELSIKV